MRRLFAIPIFVACGCYDPQLEPCAVQCDSSASCPDDMTCGADHACHAAGKADTCGTVTVTKSGDGRGTVTSDTGLACGSACERPAIDGTSVTLTAVEDAGSRFLGWSGACTGTAPCTLVVRGPLTVDAKFGLASQRLEVSFLGPAIGRVTSSPAGISCMTGDPTCSAMFAVNTTVTLAATPDPAVTFAGWGGACQGTGDCVVTLTGATQVTADFE